MMREFISFAETKAPNAIRRLKMIRRQFLALAHRVSSPTAIKHLELNILGKHALCYCYNMPATVQIETTSRCNLGCRWCYRHEDETFKRAGAGEMEIKELKTIIGQLRGVKLIHLFGGGEPLLYRDLIEAIDCAAQVIPAVNITTNGVLLAKDMADRLAKSKLTQLTVSIDAADKDIFHYIRGADLDRVCSNMKYFRSVSSIPININAVVCAENLSSLQKMPLFAKEVGANKIHFQLLHESPASDKAQLTRVTSRELIMKFARIVCEECQELHLDTNADYLPAGYMASKGICRAPFIDAYINRFGFLTPCCSWERSMSNVLESGFAAAWNSREMRRFRRLMLQEDYPDHCRTWCRKVGKTRKSAE
jgi:MoaA/NifB/PqqE/SkfB family radical SAM enzyme